MASEELLDRLDLVKRDFRDALDLGCGDGFLSERLRARGFTVVSADAGASFVSAPHRVQSDDALLPLPAVVLVSVTSVAVTPAVHNHPRPPTTRRRSPRPADH